MASERVGSYEYEERTSPSAHPTRIIKGIDFPITLLPRRKYILMPLNKKLQLAISLFSSFDTFVPVASTMMHPNAVICPIQTGWVRSIGSPVNLHLHRISSHWQSRSINSIIHPLHATFSTSATLSLKQQLPLAISNRIKETAIVWQHPMLVYRFSHIIPSL